MPVDLRALRDGLEALRLARLAGVAVDEQLRALEEVVARAIAGGSDAVAAVEVDVRNADLHYWLDYG